MIRAIVGSSLRFRLLVLGIAAGVMVVGIMQLRDAPADVLPEFTPPYVEVQTEALGLSAEEVEQLITVPLEADLLNGVEGIDTIRSESVPGLSSIVMVFEPGTDIYKARQLVQEPLTQAHALPNVSKPPTMLQPLSSSSRVMMIGALLRQAVADREVGDRALDDAAAPDGRRPASRTCPIWGMRDQQLQVQVDPRTLRDKDVTLQPGRSRPPVTRRSSRRSASSRPRRRAPAASSRRRSSGCRSATCFDNIADPDGARQGAGRGHGRQAAPDRRRRTSVRTTSR